MKKYSGILVVGAVILVVVVFTIIDCSRGFKRNAMLEESRRLADSMKMVERTKIKSQTENQPIAESNKNETPLILGFFDAKMTPVEYKEERQSLIKNGKLKLWDETHYYLDLFSINEVVRNTYRGEYSVDNYFSLELRNEPVFKNGKFVSWELPVWPILPDNSPNDKRSTNNLQQMIGYFNKLYGKLPSQSNNSTYYWIKGYLKTEVSMKNIDPDLTDGLNYKEITPVITYSALY